MATQHITIIAGHDTNEEREQQTLTWLKQHNIKVEEWNGLQVLTLQADKPSEGQYRHQWVIGFDDPEGNQESSWLVIDLAVDPYDTRLEVKYAGDYGCSCKGLACVKCNEELADVARGENPYAHHQK